jgi:hypothetical protein
MRNAMSPIDEKFEGIPVEPDTQLYSRAQIQVSGFDAVLEWWSWDGMVEGNTIAFCSDDVSHLSEEEIKGLVRSNPVIDGDLEKSTLTRGPRFTLLNFNFSEISSKPWLEIRG